MTGEECSFVSDDQILAFTHVQYTPYNITHSQSPGYKLKSNIQGVEVVKTQTACYMLAKVSVYPCGATER